MNYNYTPQVYMNKKTDDLVLIVPWFTPATEDEAAALNMRVEAVNVVYGIFWQCGWLMQNQHGVWFGLSLNAIANFELLGEL